MTAIGNDPTRLELAASTRCNVRNAVPLEFQFATHSSRSDFSKAVVRRISSIGDQREHTETRGQYNDPSLDELSLYL